MIRLFTMKRPKDLLAKTAPKFASVGLKSHTGGIAVLSTWVFSAVDTIQRNTDRKAPTVPQARIVHATVHACRRSRSAVGRPDGRISIASSARGTATGPGSCRTRGRAGP